MNHRTNALGAAAVALLVLTGTGCTATGQGKASKPGWKVFETDNPMAASPASVRSGPIELRIDECVLQERRTLIEARGWRFRLRGSIVSSEPLPIADLNGTFEILGRSGREYGGQARALGGGGPSWEHQHKTGKPTFLPANVAGRIEVVADVGSGESVDEPVSFTFKGVRVELSR